MCLMKKSDTLSLGAAAGRSSPTVKAPGAGCARTADADASRAQITRNAERRRVMFEIGSRRTWAAQHSRHGRRALHVIFFAAIAFAIFSLERRFGCQRRCSPESVGCFKAPDRG